jgi:hypothetical protein
VGQDEEPLALVRRSHVARSKTVPLRIEPERGKVFQHEGEAMPEEPGDVLEEDEGGVDLSDDPGDVGPQPPVVAGPAALSCDRPRLTREARSDDIHDSTPRLACEGKHVVPDRSEIQGLVFHPRHEDGRCIGFPLDVHHGAIGLSESEPEPQIEPTDPRTESQAIHRASSGGGG